MNEDTTYSENANSSWVSAAIRPCVVSFGCMVHDQTPPRAWSSSCFFLIINGHTVMCTAAHVLHEIRKVMDAGVVLSDWHINDVFTKTSSDILYPYNVMDQPQFLLRDDALGLDYCLIYIDWLTTTNLQRSGVKGITKARIGDATEADKWVLSGFPSVFTKAKGEGIAQVHCVFGVTPIERPDNWEPDKSQMALFGQLDQVADPILNSVDIGGMSGGPIFGLFKKEDGSPTIKLVAVQSGWSETSRVIAACPIEPFLNAVERLIEQANDASPDEAA